MKYKAEVLFPNTLIRNLTKHDLIISNKMVIFLKNTKSK